MTHSKGTWKLGNNWGEVVTNNGEGFPKDSGHDATDFYGGFLIAESIAKESDAKLISAAPDLLEALKLILPHAEIFINSNHPHHKAAIAAIGKAIG